MLPQMQHSPHHKASCHKKRLGYCQPTWPWFSSLTVTIPSATTLNQFSRDHRSQPSSVTPVLCRRRTINVHIRIAFTCKKAKHLDPADYWHKPPQFTTSAFADIMQSPHLCGETRKANTEPQKNPYQSSAHASKQQGDVILQTHADVHQKDRNRQHTNDYRGNRTTHPVLPATSPSREIKTLVPTYKPMSHFLSSFPS